MTTIKSLKDMYVKLGGSLTDTYADIAGGKAVGTYATIPEMIQACTKKASGGETLPDYTAADNGKFLGVVEGEAAWAEINGPFVVEMTADEQTGVYTSTTTYGEAYSAIQAGKTVALLIDGVYANVIFAASNDGNVGLTFFFGEIAEASGASTDTISYTPGG